MANAPIYRQVRMLQALLAFGYVAAVLLPITMLVLAGPLRAIGTIDGIGNALLAVSFPMLALQPVLAARFRVADKAFGLDGVYVFHKTMGLIAASLLLCAIIMFATAGSSGMRLPWVMNAVLIVLLVATALLSRQIHLSYEKWRLIHNALALIVLIRLFIDAAALALRSGSMAGVIAFTALFLAGASSYVFHRIVGPRRRSRSPWTVESVRPEAHNAWTLTLRPPDGVQPLAYLPGQFQFLTFNGGKGEEHPFTISSAPVRSPLHTATIKGSGDFTRTIGSVKPGDSVAVQGPFGKFSYALYPGEKDLVFIAGGIGITPIMSMLRHMQATGADIDAVLLYGNVSQKDMVFRQELEEISKGPLPRLAVVHVLGKADAEWQGERGVINEELIRKYCHGDITKKTFYLCGPPPMMASLIGKLMNLGVPSKSIRFERFAL